MKPFDPTGTFKLRASFRSEAQRRMQTLLRIVRVAVINQDLFGLAPAKPLHGIPTHLFRSEPMENSRKLQVFVDWFRGAAQTVLIGDQRWFMAHIQRAYDSGLKAAETFTKRVPASILDDLFREKAVHEIQGIIDATVQQTARVVSAGVLRGKRPRHIYLGISMVVKRVMGIRLNQFCNTMVVELHNRARIDEFRAAGMTQVGIIPERVPVKLTHDALVEVLTAGDDRVCDECQDYADGGPYDIDELELPLHIECRCAYVPVDDARFAPVENEGSEWFT